MTPAPVGKVSSPLSPKYIFRDVRLKELNGKVLTRQTAGRNRVRVNRITTPTLDADARHILHITTVGRRSATTVDYPNDGRMLRSDASPRVARRRQKFILKEVEEDQLISSYDIAEALGIDHKTVLIHLKKLMTFEQVVVVKNGRN
ncbi:hypothetical protein EVAR_27477_1 [Eumeta japonica]|uniref:Histone-lysine N-methyltransferase SETMAR n=1 Tax=Eumeta variegata TaxID=151549 RepID=A0A4C1XES5_EUMVA|nr:hypothetical protein EVAR_27477_1 [Eumeta japonica]